MKIKIEKNVKKTQMLCAFVQTDSNKPLGLKNFDAKTNLSIKQSVLDMKRRIRKIKHSSRSKWKTSRKNFISRNWK